MKGQREESVLAISSQLVPCIFQLEMSFVASLLQAPTKAAVGAWFLTLNQKDMLPQLVETGHGAMVLNRKRLELDWKEEVLHAGSMPSTNYSLKITERQREIKSSTVKRAVCSAC